MPSKHWKWVATLSVLRFERRKSILFFCSHVFAGHRSRRTHGRFGHLRFDSCNCRRRCGKEVSSVRKGIFRSRFPFILIIHHKKDVLVVAAGGIFDGRGLAMALALGAAGVWVGTRFVCAKEVNSIVCFVFKR
jgi:hypothetical protein